MKLPKSIDVAGVTYQIILEKGLGEKQGLCGYCERVEKKIVLDHSLTAPRKKKELLHTLIHEIKHAHQWEYGLSQAMSMDLQEVDAETTANVLMGLFDIRFKSSVNLKSVKVSRKLKK